MVTALIFAGGTGRRMNAFSKPKQFLELHGKPVIIYTIEVFERHPEIDNIAVVCLDSWIDELKFQIKKAMVNKVTCIVNGGVTGHDSIYNGLKELSGTASDDDIILIHDGVRPLVSDALISDNIAAVKKYGSAVSSAPAIETVAQIDCDERIYTIPDRGSMYIAKAPQSFYFKDVWEIYRRAEADNIKSIDTAQLFSHYNRAAHIVPCSRFNMKITEPADYYIFRSLFEAMENEQIPMI